MPAHSNRQPEGIDVESPRFAWLRRNLLWVDGTAGTVVGVAVLLASAWLAEWFALPRAFLLFTGAVNVAYGAYSLTLASRERRPRAWITFLVGANALWAVLSVLWVFLFRDTASAWGLAHLTAEGVFVAGLAALEWRWRDVLATD